MENISQKNNTKNIIKMKKGFTMIEVIFVMIVIGLLATMALPQINRDLRQESADTILTNIRYTQSIALSDNKHQMDNPKWEQSYWRINFKSCSDGGQYLEIGTDMDYSGSETASFSVNNAAKNPLDGKPMTWTTQSACKKGGNNDVSDSIFLTSKYQVASVSASGGCQSPSIAFDYLGRPHTGAGFTNSQESVYGGYMKNVCILTFTMNDETSFQIEIMPETGYATIINQENS